MMALDRSSELCNEISNAKHITKSQTAEIKHADFRVLSNCSFNLTILSGQTFGQSFNISKLKMQPPEYINKIFLQFDLVTYYLTHIRTWPTYYRYKHSDKVSIFSS